MIDSVQPSKLVLNLSDKLKPIPKPEDLVFGQVCRCHLIQRKMKLGVYCTYLDVRDI